MLPGAVQGAFGGGYGAGFEVPRERGRTDTPRLQTGASFVACPKPRIHCCGSAPFNWGDVTSPRTLRKDRPPPVAHTCASRAPSGAAGLLRVAPRAAAHPPVDADSTSRILSSTSASARLFSAPATTSAALVSSRSGRSAATSTDSSWSDRPAGVMVKLRRVTCGGGRGARACVREYASWLRCARLQVVCARRRSEGYAGLWVRECGRGGQSRASDALNKPSDGQATAKRLRVKALPVEPTLTATSGR
jgi:hypothetical protein